MEFCCWHQLAYQGNACLAVHVRHAAAMHVMHVAATHLAAMHVMHAAAMHLAAMRVMHAAAMHVVHVAAMHVMHVVAMHQAYCQLMDRCIDISLMPLWSSGNRKQSKYRTCTSHPITYGHRT